MKFPKGRRGGIDRTYRLPAVMARKDSSRSLGVAENSPDSHSGDHGFESRRDYRGSASRQLADGNRLENGRGEIPCGFDPHRFRTLERSEQDDPETDAAIFIVAPLAPDGTGTGLLSRTEGVRVPLAAPRLRSSVGQSNRLLSGGSLVRVQVEALPTRLSCQISLFAMSATIGRRQASTMPTSHSRVVDGNCL